MSEFLPEHVPKTAAPDLAQQIISRDPSLPLQNDERQLLNRLLSEPAALPQVFWAALLDKMLVELPQQMLIDQLQGFDRLVYNRGTTFPSDPKDGQMFGYQVATNTIWQFRYDSSISDDYKWIYTGGPPLQSSVSSGESTSSTTYVDLTTSGPSLTTPLAGDYYLTFSCRMTSSGAAYASMSPTATDADGLGLRPGGNVAFASSTRTLLKTAIAKDTTYTCKYRETAASGFTVTFSNRILLLTPVRVSG